MKEQFIKLLTFYAEQNQIPNPEKHAELWVNDYMRSIPKVDEAGTPKSITFYSNGNTLVFDNNGEQMGELQRNVDNFFFEFLELKGIDPTKIEKIRKTVNGKNKLVKPFKTSYEDWNRNFEDDND